jgi:hypothetical protein
MFEIRVFFAEAMLYAPAFQFSMNMKHGFNLHRLQNLSSEITNPLAIWLGNLVGYTWCGN